MVGVLSAAGEPDRVILFEAARVVSDPPHVVIRDFDVTQGGRQWTLHRRIQLPDHGTGRPVALADGRRILW